MKKHLVFCVFLLFISFTFAVDFEPTLARSSDSMDVVFLFDTTGSIPESPLYSIMRNTSHFIDIIEDIVDNYKLSCVTYGDGYNVWDFDSSVGYQKTANRDDFSYLIEYTGSAGGGDGPNCPLDAILAGILAYSDSMIAIPRPQTYVIYTKAPYHYEGDGSFFSSTTFLETYKYMMVSGTKLFCISDCYDASADTHYDSLARSSTGQWLNLDEPYHELYETIASSLFYDYTFSCKIVGLEGLELVDISLELHEMSFLLSSHPTYDLTFLESDRDSIRIGWVITDCIDGIHRSFEEEEEINYTITLRTTDSTYYYNGSMEIRLCGVADKSKIHESMSISAYPNPFNSSIQVNAPSGSKIQIVDLQGNKITTLSEKTTWTPSNDIESGVYLVKIHGINEVLRVVYLK